MTLPTVAAMTAHGMLLLTISMTVAATYALIHVAAADEEMMFCDDCSADSEVMMMMMIMMLAMVRRRRWVWNIIMMMTMMTMSSVLSLATEPSDSGNCSGNLQMGSRLQKNTWRSEEAYTHRASSGVRAQVVVFVMAAMPLRAAAQMWCSATVVGSVGLSVGRRPCRCRRNTPALRIVLTF